MSDRCIAFGGTGNIVVEPVDELLVDDALEVVFGGGLSDAQGDRLSLGPVFVRVVFEVDANRVVAEQDFFKADHKILPIGNALLPGLARLGDITVHLAPLCFGGPVATSVPEPSPHRVIVPAEMRSRKRFYLVRHSVGTPSCSDRHTNRLSSIGHLSWRVQATVGARSWRA